ncbi:MAG: hypothetical protein ACWGHO_04750 [Candidatus Moraniibacteriota bacterium]
MKKSIVAILVVMAMVMAGGTLANAATKLLPKGAKVSASVASDGMAQISVSGIDPEKIEYYAYDGIKEITGSAATIDLREGRRFQIVFDGGLYALLTPDMAAVPHPDFFGQGIGLDCSNSGGCCFIVTGK